MPLMGLPRGTFLGLQPDQSIRGREQLRPDPRDSSGWSTRRTNTTSRSSSTWSITTSAPTTSISGNTTAGARTTRAASISIMTIAPGRRGATIAPITAAAKSANTSATNALFWLEEFRVDGLRFDATSFIRNTRGDNNSPETDIAEGWSLLQWGQRGGSTPLPGPHHHCGRFDAEPLADQADQRRRSRLRRAMGQCFRATGSRQRGQNRGRA